MNNNDKILEIAKESNGYITTKQVRDANINTSALSRLVKQNVLERISRGYYALKDSFCDDYYKYQLKSKNCIFLIALHYVSMIYLIEFHLYST